MFDCGIGWRSGSLFFPATFVATLAWYWTDSNVATVVDFKFQLPFQNLFASRCAHAGDLLLSVATKVGKSAFYRQQLFKVLIGEVWGLGARYRISVRDLLFRAECSSSAHGY